MPRTLYITKGTYAGRYIQLEDDVADSALSDGWARESETMTPEDEQAENDRRTAATNAGTPATETSKSLDAFEQQAAGNAPVEGEPEHRTTRSRRSSAAASQEGEGGEPSRTQATSGQRVQSPSPNQASQASGTSRSTSTKPSESGE